MRDLILLPIEPLTERYTEQWYRNFPPAFVAAGFNVKVIDGKPLLDNEIKVGAFLDINSTVHYKMTQLQELARMFHSGEVKPDTVIWFSDIEFWGLESVRLMADMNGVPGVKLAGFLHAASYTEGDAFAIAAPYQRYTEIGWVAALDAVFVGSHYSKEAFVTRRLGDIPDGRYADLSSRIIVSSNPLFLDEYPTFQEVEKEDLVLLTNRFDKEKRPEQTLALFQAAKEKHPDWKFAICTSRPVLRSNQQALVDFARKLEAEGVLTIHTGLTKDQYHRMLARAKVMVSHSPEESFGYCIAEAINYNCVPLLRKGASHGEMVDYDSSCLFSPRADRYTQLGALEHAMSDKVQRYFPSVRGAMLHAPANALAFIANALKEL